MTNERLYTTEELGDICEKNAWQTAKTQIFCSLSDEPNYDNADWEDIAVFNYSNWITAEKGLWDLREQVHQYQRKHNISGIVWTEYFFNGRSIKVPSLHNQLVSVPGDREILITATPDILNWWAQSTERMDLWYSSDNESHSIKLEEILIKAPLAEWAEASVYDYEGEGNHVSLKLSWGTPEDIDYIKYKKSGCEYFSATAPQINSTTLETILNSPS